MTNITYITTTTLDLREAMPLNELVYRLSKASDDWKHPMLAQYAEIYRDTLFNFDYNDYQISTVQYFYLDIHNMVLDLFKLDNHAHTVARCLMQAIYGS
ncbi:hypothetical protein [Weissella koreensis]|uniref:Uncharacterized protein n=1 Tax=Weissella koreensis TaxID=165096 RepID=A0A7H1MMS9_9LACO|nr:hypothetical protein [Weissella koreensis]AVH75563.1 hypothetical protein C4597_05910 [Weissella koreensis]QGN20784.1 hypothetical protein GKC51_05890 [Weissella koreensis]QNT64765.1 hypothetical protein FY536_05620 [Weissella koreensis]